MLNVFLFIYFYLSCPALSISELLSEGHEKCSTELFSQVDHYSFCYTGPLECHSLFYFFILLLSYYNQNGQNLGDEKEKEEEKRSREES